MEDQLSSLATTTDEDIFSIDHISTTTTTAPTTTTLSPQQQEETDDQQPQQLLINRKYGNSPLSNNNTKQFYACGNMTQIFKSQKHNFPETFDLISLDLEGVPRSLRDKEVSLMLSGGRSSGVYSIFMIKGMERDGFLLGDGTMIYFNYIELMSDIESHKSRRFSQCVATCEGVVILEMEDEELYVFNCSDRTMKEFSSVTKKPQKKVKLIAHNKMSPVIGVYYSEDHTMEIVDLQNVNNDSSGGGGGGSKQIPLLNRSPIKAATKYADELFILVHQDDSMYVYRDGDETDGFDGVPLQITTLVETASVFQNWPIKQLAAGYSHFVVLLENGSVYTRGMNNYGQIDGQQGGEGDTVTHFHPLLHNIAGNTMNINCSSLCTTLETETEIFILGEVSQCFQRLLYPQCQDFYSFWVHRKDHPDETTAFGPWHGFIYRSEFANKHSASSKVLQYFKNNLKLLCKSRSAVLSDLSFEF